MDKVAIIGGGPAGLSCALWLKHLHLEPIIIERSDKLGGLQNIGNYENKWLIGFEGKTNLEIVRAFAEHVRKLGIDVRTQASVWNITRDESSFELELGDANLSVCALVLATGTRAQMHEAFEKIPGYAQIKNTHYVRFTFIAEQEFASLEEQDLAIVGGGDNACEAAWLLAPKVRHLHLIVRSEIKAQSWQQRRIAELVTAGKITMHTKTCIRDFDLSQNLLRISLDNGKDLHVNLLVPRTGFVPNIESTLKIFPDIKRDQKNYIVVDPHTKMSSILGVYAIGDLVEPNNPCVATAIASGTQAARAIESSLR